jgi:hypothetical protein
MDSRRLRHLARSLRQRVDPVGHAAASEDPLVPALRQISNDVELIRVPRPGADALTVWPEAPPARFLGQLEAEFQGGLAARWSKVTLEDCFFYHRSALSDGRVVEGVWNLIGGEEEYLGGVSLAGKRVLELGPASGWLSVWMEQQGADVVGFDLGWNLSADLLPLPGRDLERMAIDHLRLVSHIQNAWWFLKHDHDLGCRAVYGSIYDMPDDLGRFDVAVFGSILLHLRDPFSALQQAAMRTDEAIVVVEPLRHAGASLHEPVLTWNVTNGANPNGWWAFSPTTIVEMLSLFGFGNSSVTYHRQPYSPEEGSSAEPLSMANYTVVARR